MEKPHSSLSDREARALFRRVADGAASEEEFRALESQLLVDPALRRQYIASMNLEASLYEEVDADTRLPISSTGLISSTGKSEARHPWRIGILAAACAALGLMIGLMLQRPGQQAELPESKASLAMSKQEKESTRPQFFVEAEDSSEHESVAIVTFVSENRSGTSDGGLHSGQRLRPGILKVTEGDVQLEFLNGAQVLLRGPASLRIHSLEMVTLLSGQAASRVPDSARGFVMNGPHAAVVDLGTEFSLNVNDRGESEVHVTEGEVEVSLLGNDGNTVTSERVLQAGTMKVRSELASLESVSVPPSKELRIPERATPPLVVGPEYVNVIKEARPFAYWRFEQLESGAVLNEMGEDFPAILHTEEVNPSITLEHGVSIYRASDQPRFFSVDAGLANWNADSFSIELWACPRRLHHGAMIDILSEDWSGDLNTVELALRTSMIHPPGAFRFFHRHPPGQSSKVGINLFDHQTCTPGRWSHIVVVKTPAFLSLHINGKQIRKIEGQIAGDRDLYQLVIGQMDNSTLARQYEGALDEVALYHRALTPQEISHHANLLLK